jgi:CXXX repeat modification system protein
MNKTIWTLTEEEKNDIQVLYEKRIALENLINIIDPTNEALYDKLTDDYRKTVAKFQKWWDDIGQKYNWEKGNNWSVDFETNEVILSV